MYAKVESLGLNGLDAFSVTVEADISTGLPRWRFRTRNGYGGARESGAGAGDH